MDYWETKDKIFSTAIPTPETVCLAKNRIGTGFEHMSRNLKRLCTRMGNNEKLELYEDQPIRTAWNETEEETFEKFKDSTSEISSMTEVTALAHYG